MLPRFEKFIQERKYLENVSHATLEWYRQSFVWLGIESPDEAQLKDLRHAEFNFDRG